ncbi:hypothetical protein FA95DRAFT_1587021 [Auriscalpium vulgare]|uniref:Uncharacterized protein n=1 Tax=Auriscalpium vulgare TaxID=40419 RepID=A0ACB8S6H5_9AGAM|nr:hypothetical protein FA95DRAFT_1587021 [Auriscalpium vulgare]
MSPPVKDPSEIPPNPPRWEPSADPEAIQVPGLDASASVNDQIDQIEQLITLKLQDIDANFSKMQHVLSNRILPAFKRYSVGTEPVREAAKFWTSFYEQAAQVRIPTYEDFSSVQEQTSAASAQAEPGETTAPKHTAASASNITSIVFDPNQTPADTSFLPGQAAISSTPAATSRLRVQNPHDTFSSQGSEPSWAASLESPLIRLNRELRDFARDDQSPISESMADLTEDRTVDQTIHAPSFLPQSPEKGKSRQTSLRHDVLRGALTPASTSRKAVSPLKVRKPKTPIPASRNPYLPEGTDPHKWTGIVDLKDPSVATPQRRVHAPRTGAPPAATPNTPSDADDFDLPPGMSPPVTMAFATLPQLGRTPRKEAAARIGRDLVGDAQRLHGGSKPINSHLDALRRGNYGSETSVSTAPTPPSLSRYRDSAYPGSTSTSLAGESTLDSMMRRVERSAYRDDQQPSSSTVLSALPESEETPSYYTSHAPLHPHNYQQRSPPRMPVTPDQYGQYGSPLAETSQQYGDSSTDSLDDDDEINDTAHPSAAFLMASRQRGRDDDEDDDSFGSSNASSDSLSGEEGGESVHPFALGQGGYVDEDEEFDDSFEEQGGAVRGEVEETVFGVPPAERAARASQDRLGVPGDAEWNTGRVEETPTPWGAPR